MSRIWEVDLWQEPERIQEPANTIGSVIVGAIWMALLILAAVIA